MSELGLCSDTPIHNITGENPWNIMHRNAAFASRVLPLGALWYCLLGTTSVGGTSVYGTVFGIVAQ